jgi:predicted transcriptional regulator
MNAHSHDYPNGPAIGKTDTSADAARSIELSVGHLQRVALRAIRAAGGRGLTTNELVSVVNINRDTIQPRTSELKELGLIRDSGARRTNANGKRAIVWVAVTDGEAAR